MISSRHFDRIAWSVAAVMLAITILFMNGTSIGLESTIRSLGYEQKLFDNSYVHTINIIIDDWDSFISTATTEAYSPVVMEIDGEVYKNVAIRGKGNTSLSNVASMNSQRYSLKVEFDHYDKSKRYYGLDKFALNNMIQDSTMMKDYLTYTMMNEFGVNAPLCSFVYITVNGEDWGLYLAVEGVEDSFLQRNYGNDPGDLYKPDSIGFGGGRGNGQNFRMSEFWNENFDSSDESDSENADQTAKEAEQTAPENGTSQFPSAPGGFDPSQMGGMSFPGFPGGDMPEGFEPPSQPGGFDGEGFTPPEMPEGSESEGFTPPEMPGGSGRGGFGGPGGGLGSSDVKLQYTDDELSSYTNIWENAKTDVTEADQKRLIQSMKKLTNNEDIESVVDIDQVIRYFVVHNYVCNGDSYTGQMIHNYYLYEKDGKMAMIPWDYNLAFGTFQSGDANGTINTPIDSPVSRGSEDRPMLNWIYANEEYTELYHQYFAEFLESVDIIGIIDAAYELIAPYVEKDPTAFYTAEEFETGVATLRGFCELRTESIRKQLETGNTTEDMNYVNASSLELSEMGSMGGGKGGFGGGGRPGETSGNDRGPGEGRPSGRGGFPGDFSGMKKRGSSDGTPTDTGNESTEPADVQPSGETSGGDNGSPSFPGAETAPQGETGENSGPGRDFQPGGGGMTPPGNMPFDMGGMSGSTSGIDIKTAGIWLGPSLILLAVGLFAAKKFKIW